VVRNWYTGLGPGTPVIRSHAYGLLRTILGSAVSEQIIPFNPCVMRGAGSAATSVRPKPATLTEIATIAQHMPERLQLAAWCGLRFGELIELRRSDIDQVSKSFTYAAPRTEYPVIRSPSASPSRMQVFET